MLMALSGTLDMLLLPFLLYIDTLKLSQSISPFCRKWRMIICTIEEKSHSLTLHSICQENCVL